MVKSKYSYCVVTGSPCYMFADVLYTAQLSIEPIPTYIVRNYITRLFTILNYYF